MKKGKTTIGIVAIIATLTIAAVAFAQGGYGRHMSNESGQMMGSGHNYKMMDKCPGYGQHMRSSESGYGRHMSNDDGNTMRQGYGQHRRGFEKERDTFVNDNP